MSNLKLTKKQKKGLAFRQRTLGKRQSRNELMEMETAAVPIMEDQDIVSIQSDTLQDTTKGREGDETVRVSGQDKQGRVANKGKRTAEEKVSIEVVKTIKRKRASCEDGAREDQTSEFQSRKVLKREKDSDVTQSSKTKGKTEVKQRFILFIGNLKYTTTREAIQDHFAICDPPPTIRLLTHTSTQRSKSKGCAFLEFTHRNALQQALKLHQSTLEGRMINVELTAGGGGKGGTRLAKVRERNKALQMQRTERIEMEDPNGDRLSQRPQRFSATSGMEQVPVAKRSWTVGDGDDDKTHRGGVKHKKKSKAKTWGTGVNAIPVG